MGELRLTLLDTHAILWWQAGSTRLSAPARRAIEAARTILVSPISFWEVALLVEKRRVELDRDVVVWVQDFLEGDRVELAGLTSTVAVAAGRLPAAGFEGDPADAIIYATARERGATIASKDLRIRGHALTRRDVKVIW